MVGQGVTRIYGGEAAANEVLREMRKRGGTVSGFDSVLWAKGRNAQYPFLSRRHCCSTKTAIKSERWVCYRPRARKRAQEELEKAYDELEKRVEERTLELNEARGRLQYLLTVTPGIMYTNLPTDGYKCSFVSRNVDPIMGFSEWEMLEDPEFWPKRLHPDDVNRVFEEMGPLVDGGGGTIEYRFRHRDGHYVWIQDTFKVVHDDAGKPLEIVGSWADITHRKQVEHALGERMAFMNDLQNSRRGESGSHLYDPGFRRFRLHVRQRESENDYGIRSLGDARGYEVLAQKTSSRRRPSRLRRTRQARRTRRRHDRVSVSGIVAAITFGSRIPSPPRKIRTEVLRNLSARGRTFPTGRRSRRN